MKFINEKLTQIVLLLAVVLLSACSGGSGGGNTGGGAVNSQAQGFWGATSTIELLLS